jgi:hypothetical protein
MWQDPAWGENPDTGQQYHAEYEDLFHAFFFWHWGAALLAECGHEQEAAEMREQPSQASVTSLHDTILASIAKDRLWWKTWADQSSQLTGTSPCPELSMREATWERMNAEIDSYLCIKQVMITSDYSILGWWARNEVQFPSLAVMAQDILAVPIAGVGVEQVFNSTQDIVTYWQHNLKAKTIQSLAFIKFSMPKSTEGQWEQSFGISNAFIDGVDEIVECVPDDFMEGSAQPEHNVHQILPVADCDMLDTHDDLYDSGDELATWSEKSQLDHAQSDQPESELENLSSASHTSSFLEIIPTVACQQQGEGHAETLLASVHSPGQVKPLTPPMAVVLPPPPWTLPKLLHFPPWVHPLRRYLSPPALPENIGHPSTQLAPAKASHPATQQLWPHTRYNGVCTSTQVQATAQNSLSQYILDNCKYTWH